MSNLRSRLNRAVRKNSVFVSGPVLRAICNYLRARKQKRDSNVQFAKQLKSFWSKYAIISRRGNAESTSELLSMFESSLELQESYILTWIEFQCESNPDGLWISKTEWPAYSHYYQKAKDFMDKRGFAYNLRN